MGRVIHFEIQGTDPDALIAYYAALFDWKFARWGDVPYWTITTGPDSEAGINGGLLPRRGGAPSPMQPVNSHVCTVAVDSLDATLRKNASLGGTVAVPRMAIPGVGWLAYVKDPDGNIVGIMQADPSAA
jgi:uncharacterized protein